MATERTYGGHTLADLKAILSDSNANGWEDPDLDAVLAAFPALIAHIEDLETRIVGLEAAANDGAEYEGRLSEALKDADGYLEADDAEEAPGSRMRRRLREKIRAVLNSGRQP